MSGTHLVAGDYRWGKNPSRSFPSEYSPATCRWGNLSPATCRWGKSRHVARETSYCCKHYSSETLFTSRNCPSQEGMEGKSFEEGLAEITETLKRLQSTLLEKLPDGLKIALEPSPSFNPTGGGVGVHTSVLCKLGLIGVGSQCEQEFYPEICDALYKSLYGNNPELKIRLWALKNRRRYLLSVDQDKYRDRSCGEDRYARKKDGGKSVSPSSESLPVNGGHWKSRRSKRHNLVDEDDLAVPWTYEDVDLFTPRIRNFKSLWKTRMPNNVKTYNGTGDPKDHLKIFQAAVQVERWAMPTWCHVFNYTLIGATRVWFDELPPESIDGYKGLKAAFLAYFMQQKKYVKDPVEIHNIKQRDRETIEDFMERFKVETRRMMGAPECMQISGFMHGVNNPELTKRLNEHIPNTMEEMMTVTTAFIRGEAAAASKKKGHLPWKSQD
ncbi:reverse transcriptase domain-containing protein [Tanacetum coccineum]